MWEGCCTDMFEREDEVVVEVMVVVGLGLRVKGLGRVHYRQGGSLL